MTRITQILTPKYEESLPATATEEGRQHCRDAQRSLQSAFIWSHTAEGMAFWESVSRRLLAIAGGEPLK